MKQGLLRKKRTIRFALLTFCLLASAGSWAQNNSNVTISGAGTGLPTGGSFSGGIFTPSANNAIIPAGTLANQIAANASVTINTACASCTQIGNVTFSTAVTATPTSTSALTVNAGGNITVSSGNAITLTPNAVGSGTGIPGTNLTLTSSTGGSVSIAAAITTTGGGNTGSGNGGIGGAITITGPAGVTISAALTASGGSAKTTGGGGTGGAGANMSITGASGITLGANLTNTGGAGKSGTGASGNYTINDGASTYTTSNGTGVNDGQYNNGTSTTSIISGGNLTLSGTGTFLIGGYSGSGSSPNTYTGTINVNAGILKFDNHSPLGSGTVTVANLAAIDMGGYNDATVQALTLNGSGPASSPTGALRNTGGSDSYAGLITLGSSSTIGGIGGAIDISNAGTITGTGTTLTLSGAGGGTVASIIGTSTGGSVVVSGGNWSLTANNSAAYTGGTTVSGGTLTITAANQLPTAGTVTLNGGTLATGTTAFTGTFGALDLTANSTISYGSTSVAQSLKFAVSTGQTWTGGTMLTINNWQGSYNGTAGTEGRFYAGTTNAGLLASQVQKIQFYNGTANYPAEEIAANTGEVVPYLPSPTMNSQPSATTVCAGGSTTFTAAANSPAAATAQWLINTGSGFTNLTIVSPYSVNTSSTGGVTTSVLTINPASLSLNSYLYEVKFTNSSGNVTSGSATLTVNANPNAVITGTLSVCASAGGTTLSASSSTAGSGTINGYQWALGGSSIGGATNSTYTATSSGSYTVIVSNTNNCSTTSTGSTVAVNANPTAVISAGTLTGCVSPGVALGTTGSSAGSGTISGYQWSNSGGNIGGATSSTYTATASDNYTVVITNSNNCSATSSASSVTANTNPTAVISAGTLTGCVSPGVALGTTGSSAGSGSINGYQWALGGSSIGGATSSTYTATATGNYTVVVSNSNNCSTTSTASSVTANANPTAVISGTLTGCITPGVALGTSGSGPGSGSISSYQWSLGGSSIGGATSSTYTATSTGSYTVVITNSNNCSATSTASSVTANTNPTAVISAGTLTGCVSPGVALGTTGSSAGSGTISGYQWGNSGGNIGGATSSTYTATASSNYTVVVTNSNNCSATSTVSAVTANTNPTAVISGTLTVCASTGGAALSASSSTPGSGTISGYQWAVGGGNIGGATSSAYTATSSGSYTVIVSNTNNCSTTSTGSTVTVNANPTAVISAGTLTGCVSPGVALGTTGSSAGSGTISGYQWSNSGGNIGGATSSTYTATASDNYTVVITNSNNCSATSSASSVTANTNPTAVISAGTLTGCVNPGVALGTTGSSAGSGTISGYQWKNSSGNIGGATASTYTATASSNYSVVVSNSNNCSTTSTASAVTANANPTAVISGTLTGCINPGVALGTTGSSAGSGSLNGYQWSNSGGNIGGATSSTYTATASDNYTVVITNTNNCSATSTASSVTANTNPTAVISAGTLTGCVSPGVALGTTGSAAGSGTISGYQWKNSSGNIGGATSSTYTATASSNYTVVITNSNNCSAASTASAVTANTNPTALISGTLSGCASAGVPLGTTGSSAGSGSINGYQWNLGGTPIGGATGSTYTASSSGSYTVIISNTNSCSTTSTGSTVTVNANPTAVISASTLTGCVSPGVALGTTGSSAGSGSISGYQWSNSGGNIGGATSSTYTATASSNYTVVVINSNNCSATSTASTVTANANATPTFVSPITTTCQNSTGNIYTTQSGQSNYQWSISGGTITAGGTATDNTATVSWTTAGTESISVNYANSNNCPAASPTQQNVTVNTLPADKTVTPATTAVFSGNSTTITVSSSTSGISYQLRNGTTNVGSAQNGSGGTLTFNTGTLTTTTTFNILATNSTTNCTFQLSTTPTITVVAAGGGYYRSIGTANWSVITNWQTSADNVNWVAATSAPTSSALGITISSGNTITVAAAATASNLTITGTLTMSTTNTLGVTGNWTNNGVFNQANSTVTFNGSSAQTIAGSATSTFYNLIINESTTTTNVTSTTTAFAVASAGSLTVTQGNLVLQATNANYTIGGNVTVSANGTITNSMDWNTYGKAFVVSGNFSVSGLLTYSIRSTIVLNGANTTFNSGNTPGSAFDILLLENTSGTITANGTVVANDNFWAAIGQTGGTFSIPAGQTVTANGGLFNEGNIINLSGGTLNISGGLLVGYGAAGTFNLSSGILNTDGINVGYNGNGISNSVGTFNQSGGTVNLSGSLLIHASSTYTCTNSPAINIAGNMADSGTFTPATSTVTFNGSGAQSIFGTAATQNFDLVVINNPSGSVTVGGTTTTLNLNDDFTITAGTFAAGTATNINAVGDWINSGAFTPGTGRVTFDGTAVQNIAGSSVTTFYNVTLNNGTGLVLNGVNATINSILTLTSGKVTTGSDTLIMASTSATSISGAAAGKYIYGYLNKGIANGTGATQTFEIGDASNYTPMSLTFSGTVSGSGSLTGYTVPANEPNIATSTINEAENVYRYWGLKSNSVTGYTSYTLTVNFVAGDIIGGANTSTFIMGHDNGGWGYATIGTRTGTSTQGSGLGGFGTYAVGQGGAGVPTMYSQPGSVSACIPNSTGFIAISNSVPPSTVQWEVYNGTTYSILSNSSPYSINTTSNSSQTTSNLTINPSSLSLNGLQYLAVFTNTKGTLFSNQVVLTTSTPPTVMPGGPDNVCQSSSPTPLTLTGSGVGGGASTGAWSITSGGGSLSSTSQTNNPAAVTYTPAANYTGTVVLTLTSNSPSGCSAATGTRTVNVNPLPIANAAGPDNVCQSSSPSAYALSGASIGGGATTGAWSIVSGGGSLSSTAQTSTPATVTYTPQAGYTGTATLMLTTNAPNCGTPTTSTRTVNVNPSAISTPGGPDNVCQSASPSAYALTGASVSGGATTGAWSITSGGGSLSSTAQTSNPAAVTYTPAANFSGTATLTLTTNAPGACSAVSNTRTVNVNAIPLATASNSSQTICSGTPFTTMALGTSNNITGTTFTWLRNNTASVTGIASSGSGSSIMGVTLTNTTSSAVTVTFTITPTGPTPTSCPGSAITATILVNPAPSVSTTPAPATICLNNNSVLTTTNSGGTINQTFTGSSGTISNAIPDNSTTGTSSTITLSGSNGMTLVSTDVIQVTVNITHPNDADLDIFLVDPSGTKAMLLSSGNGGTGNNYTNTVLSTSASTNITSGTSPFTGTYLPEGNITTVPVRTGAASNGAGNYNAVIPGTDLVGAAFDGGWVIKVFDHQQNNTGTLTSWSLSINRPSSYATSVSGPGTIGSVSYSGANNTTATATVTPPASGANVYTITTTDGIGCANSTTATVNVNALPSASISTIENSGGTANDGVICTGATVTLTANPTSGMTYAWASPVGGTGNNKSVTPASTTSYTVTVTNSTTNCSITSSATVTVPLPSASITETDNSGKTINDGIICNGDPATLTANPTSGMNYSWTTTATTDAITVTPSSTGSYSVTVTEPVTGCSLTASSSVTVNAVPVVTATANYCYGGGDVQLTSTAESTYLWSTGGTTQTILVDEAGTYTVTATNTNGCSATASQQVALELVTNGNFNSGNTGFTTGYTYESPAANIAANYQGLEPEGLYAVDANAHTYHPLFWGVDHTSGTGNFMIVNGATFATQPIVWSETVTIQPNTVYYFSAWAMSVNQVGNYAILQFNVNGNSVGTLDTLTAGPNDTTEAVQDNRWTRFYGTWNSGSSTSAVISIVDLQTQAGGNDFGLDDISCSTLSTVTLGSTAASSGGNAICAGNGISLLANRVGGESPYTFTWSGPNSFSSTLENPTISSATTANTGTYSLTITDAHGCSTSSSISITVNNAPTLTPGTSPAVCQSASPVAAALTGASFGGGASTAAWSITSGGGALSSTAQTATPQNVTYTPAANFNGTVTLTLTSSTPGGCSSTSAQRTITVNPLPSPTFTTAPTPVCNNSTGNVYTTQSSQSNYTWTISGGTITAGGGSSNNTATVTWTTPGSESISVNYANSFGCSAASATTQSVTVNALPSPSFAGTASTIVNYNFNSGSSFAGLSPTLASNITSTATGSAAFATTTGVASGGNAFTSNGTAGNALTSAPNNTWTFTLGGSSLSSYGTFVVYFQAERNTGGSNTINLTYSLNGGTYTSTGIVASVGAEPLTMTTSATWYEGLFTIPVAANNPATSLAFQLTIGTTGTGNVQLDNFEVQAVPTGGPATVCLNSTGNVYTTQSGQSNYIWTINGGTITSGGGTSNSSATVTWTTPGSESISVNYTNSNGCTAGSATTENVTVNTLPTPTFTTAPTPVCNNSTGNIYTTQSGQANYVWTISGGTITAGGGSSNNTATVTWNTVGSESISVNYSNSNGCTAGSATSQGVTVNGLPSPTFTTAPTPVCNNSTGNVYTTQSGQSNYVWTISGGTITSGGGSSNNTATVTWNTVGTESISVNYANSNGCSAGSATTQNVTVNALPTPTFTGGSTTVCNNSTGNVYTTQSGFSNYIWTINGGTITSGGGTSNNTATVTWTTAGAESISVNYTNGNGCTAGSPATDNVTVNALPTPTFTTAPTPVCNNSTGNVYSTQSGQTNYLWTISGGTITSGGGTTNNTATVTWTTPGSESISINYKNAAGCTAGSVTTQNVTVNSLPTPSFTAAPSTTCINTPGYVYTTQPGESNYQWTISGGSFTSGGNTSSNTGTVTWTSSGTKSISINYTDGNGCTAATATSQSVTVQTAPSISTQPSGGTVCLGGPLNLSVSAGGSSISYQWQLGGVNIPGANSSSYSVANAGSGNAGNYDVVISNSSCPSATSNTAAIVVTSALNIPYLEDFESISSADQYPNCLTSTNLGSKTFTRINNSSVAYSGSNYGSFGPSANDWFFTPGINLTAGTAYMFYYYYNTDNTSSFTSFGGAVGTLPQSSSMTTAVFTTLSQSTIPGTSSYYQYTAVFTPSTSGVYYFGAHATSNPGESQDKMVIDNIGVELACNGTPTAGTASTSSNLVCSGTAVNLSLAGYTTGFGGITFQWQSSPTGLNTWSNISGATATTYSPTVTVSTDFRCNVTCIYSSSTAASNTVTVIANTQSGNPTSATATPSAICFGQSSVLKLNGGGGGTGEVIKWYTSSCGGTLVGTGNNLSVNPATTTTYYGRYEDGSPCSYNSTCASVTVTVNPLPTPTFTTAPTPVCLNSTGNVYTTQSGQSNYLWTINGGSITGGGGTSNNTATVTWTSAGSQSISVNYTNSKGCTATSATTQNVTVNPLPTPTFTTAPTPVCLNSTGNVYTTESGKSNYVWAISGGTITAGGNSSSNTATVTWTAAGSKSISINYSDGNGCTAGAATAQSVTVNALPTPSFTTAPTPVCLNSTGNVYTTQAGESNYQWTINGGTITSGGGASNNTATVTWTASGSKSITVNYTDANGCTAASVTSQSVTVNTLPSPTFTTAPTPVCLNSTGNVYSTQASESNYIWTISGGSITAGGGASNNTATVTWTSTGTQSISVNYTDGNGCTAASATNQNVTVRTLPVPSFTTAPTPVCLNSTGNVYTSQSGESNYVWAISGGTITAGGGNTDNSATVTWTNPGNESIGVSYTDGNGCTAASATTQGVTVNALPTPTFTTAPSPVCLNSTGNVYSTQAGKQGYVWTITGGTISSGGSSTDNTATVTWTSSGTETISVNYTDGNGCTAGSATVQSVTVNALPTVFSVTGGACIPALIGLSGSQNGTDYQLLVNNGPIGSPLVGNGSSLNFGDQIDSGIYTVVATNPSTGCMATMIGAASISFCTSTWIGVTDTDWNTQTNWDPAAVPNNCYVDVLIPHGTPFLPVISQGDINVRNINIASSVTLTLTNRNLNVCGNWTGGSANNALVLGNGTVFMNSSVISQTISGNTRFDILQVANSMNVALNRTAMVSITEGLQLKQGNFDVTFGTLHLLSTSASNNSYIDDFSSGFTGTITGTVKVDRYAPVPGSNQHYVSSPVNTPAFSQLSAYGPDGSYVVPSWNCDETQSAYGSPYGSVFQYNDGHMGPNQCMLGNWQIRSTGNTDNARGYSVYLTGNSTLTLSGIANTGNVSVGNLNNSGYPTVNTLQGDPIESGWNLVGNPYPSSLDMTADRTVDGFQNQVQIWKTTGPYAGSWQPAIITGNSGEVVVPPFQAFMVRVSPSSTGLHTYKFYQAERTRTTNIPFYRTQSVHTLTLGLDYNGVKDATTVAFNPTATTGFDDAYDANKYDGSPGRPTLYTNMSGTWYAINTLPSLTTTATVPMGLKPDVNGAMTITPQGIETFDATSYIYLEDKKTGVWQNLRDGAYTFTTTATDSQQRFVLHFTPPAVILTSDASCEAAGMINIEQPGTANWNYTLTDNANNTISTGTLNQNSPVSMNVGAGVYTLTLKDATGYTVVKAIQVNGTQAVVASFNSSVTAAQVLQNVTFNSTSANAATYNWEFGDGITATGATANHSYSAEGVYNVTLNVTNAGGCTSATSHTITVTSSVATGIATVSSNAAIRIWSNDDRVYVDFSAEAKVDAQIEIYNVLGQLLSNERFGKSNVYSKEIANMEAAYMVVKVTNEGEVTTKKVFLGNADK